MTVSEKLDPSVELGVARAKLRRLEEQYYRDDSVKANNELVLATSLVSIATSLERIANLLEHRGDSGD
mgnify:CR=1 FL=1